MNAEYIKAANKLLYGITDKRLREPEIWNDILSSVRSGRLQLWEINDEILRIKYFCKEKIELASTFAETYRSDVRFDDLNEYFSPPLRAVTKDILKRSSRLTRLPLKIPPTVLLCITV